MDNDFSKGKVWQRIVAQAVPLTLAQLVHLLYNIVDRIYIGHMPDVGSLALTGVGITFPVITLIAAFTNLVGMGGTPLFSIARGETDEKKAGKILGNSFSLLLLGSLVLFLICYILKKPILFLFGASEASYVYANEYLCVYLFGTVFAMLSTGLNGFINAQGFAKTGMLTTVIGAVINIVLDPIFIFVFNMGVGGAALATVISQALSALWVLRFLTGKKALQKIKKENLKIDVDIAKRITSLGTAGFIMQGTNCLVQVVCNNTLQSYGGDLYVGIMTVINSVREVMSLAVSGISGGAQPVIGFNYGAREYKRVKSGIRFMSILGMSYTVLAWIFVMIFSKEMFAIFSSDAETLLKGPEMLNIYFFGFFFMSFQFSGQSAFQALGHAKKAIFFSLFRKVIIVVPLTLILPMVGLGVKGVFWAEPVSNAIGGLACFIAMWRSVYRKL